MSTANALLVTRDQRSPSSDFVQQKTHFTSVDGLRALACLVVLSHHCYYHAGRYDWPQLRVFSHKLVLSHIFSMGYLGVELFFVLSGFCLAFPMLTRPETANNWKRYALHRARRILPTYWWILLILTAANVVIYHFNIRPFTTAIGFGVFSIQHWLWAFFLIAVLYNTAFWTLTVEARWYCLLPALMYALKRGRTTGLFALTIAASLLYAVVQYRLSAKLNFLIGPLPLFLPLFALGIAAASITAQKEVPRRLVSTARYGFVASLALILCVTPTTPNHPFDYRCIVPAGIASFFLLLLALHDPGVTRIFSYRPLAFVGTFSYSLYLIHLPIIHLVYSVTKHYKWPAWEQFCFYQGAVFSACILLGYLFYLFAEKPYLNRKRTKVQEQQTILAPQT